MPETALALALWPRLSETLTSPAKRLVCQACGLTAAPPSIEWWQEHDEADKPEPIIVVLCSSCAPEIVPPHSRLYRQLAPNEPMPGAMQICETCVHRNTQAGLRCGHPKARINGGPGLAIKIKKPDVGAPLLRSGKGRWLRWWTHQATGCTGREVTA